MRAVKFANECIDETLGKKFIGRTVVRAEISEVVRVALEKYTKQILALSSNEKLNEQIKALLK